MVETLIALSLTGRIGRQRGKPFSTNGIVELVRFHGQWDPVAAHPGRPESPGHPRQEGPAWLRPGRVAKG